jgi:protein TonB
MSSDSRPVPHPHRKPAFAAATSRQDLQFILPESSTHLGTVFGGAGAIYVIGGLLAAMLLWLRPPMPPITVPIPHDVLPSFIFPNIIGASGGGSSGGGNLSNPLKPVRTAEQPLTRLPEPMPQPVPEQRLVPPPEVTPAAVPSTILSDNPAALAGPNAPTPDLGSGPNGVGGPGRNGNGPGPGGAPGRNGGPDGGPGGPGPGGGVDVQVVALSTPKPAYTSAAMQRRIEGEVGLSCVVLTTGRVGQCRITKSLDANFGLDEEALKAAAKFVFKPAQRNGQPVPVTVNIVLEFHMR